MIPFPAILIDGYREFKKEKFSHETERYRKLAEQGQTPEIMVIACCDSRAAPEVIFNAIPGEIFVARNVANLVPPYRPDGEFHSTSAALEFAVQVLKIKHIVVLGHGRCGGIRAALDPNEEPLSPGDFIGKWMGLLAPAAEEISADKNLTPSQRQMALEHVSVRHSIKNLRTFPCISILESRNRLSLHGAWFDIANGELMTLDSRTGTFSSPLKQPE
jgi:carbonic anhydrase